MRWVKRGRLGYWYCDLHLSRAFVYKFHSPSRISTRHIVASLIQNNISIYTLWTTRLNPIWTRSCGWWWFQTPSLILFTGSAAASSNYFKCHNIDWDMGVHVCGESIVQIEVFSTLYFSIVWFFSTAILFLHQSTIFQLAVLLSVDKLFTLSPTIIRAMRLLVAALALFSAAVCGQKTVTWTEASSGVQYNLAIPEAAAAPFDVYVSIISPVNNTYAAIAFGGCMLRSPLLVAWKNDTNIVVAPRWAT